MHVFGDSQCLIKYVTLSHVIPELVYNTLVFATLTCVRGQWFDKLVPCNVGFTSELSLFGQWRETKDAGNQGMPECSWFSDDNLIGAAKTHYMSPKIDIN